MSSIYLVGGEKGGVGKSMVARLLAQYFIDHAIPFQAFDCDRSNGALQRFYGAYSTPIALEEYNSLDRIVEAAIANPEQRVLVDLAAQTHQQLARWMEDSRLLEFAGESDLNIRYWHVMDGGFDSVELLRRLLDQFGGRLKLVVVLNQLRNERFELFESSGQRARALELGAKIMVLPKLAESTMQKIDATSASFWAAVNNAAGAEGNLGLLERQRVWVWVKRAYEEIERIGT